MPRFFLPPEAWQGEPALVGDEAKHLAQVLRIKAGGSVSVFDGRGRRAAAEVLGVSRERVTLKLGEPEISAPLRPAVTLAQAIPKGKNMDLIVQKAVELGVARIQPLVTRHTVVQPGEGKAERWRRVALEACKQCGQDHLPEVAEPRDFQDWLDAGVGGLRIVASLASGARPFREVLEAQREPETLTLLIGPEGDFSPTETAAAIASGFAPVTLGSITLRVETAAIFSLSAVRFAFA